MGEKVTIPVEFDLDVVRRFQVSGVARQTADAYERFAADAGLESLAALYAHIHSAAKAAVLRFEPPWEPSEQDVTDWCEARAWKPERPVDRSDARQILRAARARGWDAVPRRIEGAVNDG